MKLAHITPPAWLESLAPFMGNYHLVLAPLVHSNKTYADFYRRAALRGDTVILDNGAFEAGRSVPIEELIEAHLRIGASIIVLPDDMNADWITNWELAEEGAERLAKLNAPFMIVPHGEDLESYIDGARKMCHIKGVNCIGIYKHAARDYRVSRAVLAKMLDDQTSTKWLGMHLLGVNGDLRELTDPYVRWRCMGVDTSRFVLQGSRGVEVLPPQFHRDEKPPRPDNYFDLTHDDLSGEQFVYIMRNLERWRNLCE